MSARRDSPEKAENDEDVLGLFGPEARLLGTRARVWSGQRERESCRTRRKRKEEA
jgi:hypothetical protein